MFELAAKVTVLAYIVFICLGAVAVFMAYSAANGDPVTGGAIVDAFWALIGSMLGA